MFKMVESLRTREDSFKVLSFMCVRIEINRTGSDLLLNIALYAGQS